MRGGLCGLGAIPFYYVTFWVGGVLDAGLGNPLSSHTEKQYAGLNSGPLLGFLI